MDKLVVLLSLGGKILFILLILDQKIHTASSVCNIYESAFFFFISKISQKPVDFSRNARQEQKFQIKSASAARQKKISVFLYSKKANGVSKKIFIALEGTMFFLQ